MNRNPSARCFRVRREWKTELYGRCAVLLAVTALLSVGACRKDEPTEQAHVGTDDGRKTVGVSLLTMQHQFYQELRAGLESAANPQSGAANPQSGAAKDRGFRLLVVSAEFDPARQANQLDEFIVQKVDAIVVCPCDSRSVGASIAAANQANIPVFTADIANLSPIGKVVSHIASDNVLGGREAAKLLAQAMAGRGSVAILSHPEVASVSDRVRGFKEQIANSPPAIAGSPPPTGGSPGIRIVAELSAEGKRDKAVRVMEDLLQSHADLGGVFCINDDTALGALAAIEAAGKLGKVKIVGYDATPEARAKIAAGAIFGDVIQNPRRIGELTIGAIADYFEGRTPPPVIPVEVGTHTGQSGRP